MEIQLRDAIDRRSVKVGAEVDDWRAAVRLAGSLLVDAGAAEERYVDAMIRTVEELGPYVVLAPGIAVPHARPEHGAVQVGFSVLVLRTPVKFGAKDNDPVDLVFGFATPSAEAHTAALQKLATFLEEADNVDALRGAGTADDVLRLLEG